MHQGWIILASLAFELAPGGPMARRVLDAAFDRPSDDTVFLDVIWKLAERHEANRWWLIERAAADVEPFRDVDFTTIGRWSWELDAPTAQRDATEALESLARAGTFETLDRIADGGHFLRPREGDAHASDDRQLFRACIARMELALLQDLPHEPARAFRQAIGLARAIGSQPMPIDRLVANAMISGACGVAREACRKGHDAGRLRAVDLRAMIAELDPPLLPPIDAHVRALHLERHGTAEACYTFEGRPLVSAVVRASMSPMDWEALGPGRAVFAAFDIAGPFLISPRVRTRALLRERFEAWERLAGRPPAEAARDALHIRTTEAWHDLPVWLATGEWITPTPFEASLAAGQAKIEFDVAATRLALAIECFERERGRYPESLEALVPGFLPSLPQDSITGTPFGYRRTDDAYVLYSTGFDGRDDGGLAHPASRNRVRSDLYRRLIPARPLPDLRDVLPWAPPPEPVPDPVEGVDLIIIGPD